MAEAGAGLEADAVLGRAESVHFIAALAASIPGASAPAAAVFPQTDPDPPILP